MRMTRQRRAIRAALEQARRPLSPNEIVSYAGGQVAGLHLATVYRTLRAMGASGEIAEVPCVGQPARYELAGMAHHHHFLCCDCDRLFDLDGCVAEAVARLAPAGFEVTAHELQLVGRCQDCRAPATGPATGLEPQARL